MSDQNHPPLTTPGEEHFYQASASQAQVAPLRSIPPGAPINQPAAKEFAFPLIHKLPPRLRVPAMLFYGILLIIALTSGLLALNTSSAAYSDPHQQSPLVFMFQSFMLLFMVLVLVPASTLLCSLFFGSWRGTLISCVSIYTSIQFTHLLNQHFWSDTSLGSFQFLITVMLITFCVGLSYDLRKRVHQTWWSILILVGAAFILACQFSYLLAYITGDYSGGVIIWFGMGVLGFLAWIYLTLATEVLIQETISGKKETSRG